MLTAKEAREKQQFAAESRKLSFDEALKAIEDEIISCAFDDLSHITLTLSINKETAKQLKKALKEAGYRWIDFDEYSFGYVVSCSW